MKKMSNQLPDGNELLTIEHNGQELTFLNGVIQIRTGGKFLAAKGPINGELMLIIEDYVFWVNNQTAIEAWMFEYGTGIRQQGMVLHFEHDSDRTMFMLRWA
jgi:hypothetical protein